MSYSRQNVFLIVTKTPSGKKGDDEFCYGDEGSPLWKFHNSVNGFDKEVQLAVLTGILTRYLLFANMYLSTMMHLYLVPIFVRKS